MKCDETHPDCVRCQTSGRTCEGYITWVPRSLRQLQPSLIPGADVADFRSLDFYRRYMAPDLAGTLPRSFWTHIVPQVLHQEPAIRHAALAMSSLYEKHKGKRQMSATDRKYAISHYNAALQQIAVSQPENLDVVVIACMQFICIEFLRGNPSGALVHYQYGKNLLLTYNPNAALIDIFRRLNFFIFFFSNFTGASQSEYDCPPPSGPFESVEQAQETLGWLTYRTMKVAAGITKRPNDIYNPESPSSAFSQWKSLNKDFEDWSNAVARLKNKDPLSVQMDTYKLLEARWLVCKIWTRNGSSPNGALGSEKEFKRIVEIACNVSGGKDGPEKSPFGFPALLYFVLMQSRTLELRLVALSIFEDNCLSDNMLWDAELLYQSAKKAIEEDHNISLDAQLDRRDDSGGPVPIKRPGQILQTQQTLCSWVVVVMDACSDLRQPKQITA